MLFMEIVAAKENTESEGKDKDIGGVAEHSRFPQSFSLKSENFTTTLREKKNVLLERLLQSSPLSFMLPHIANRPRKSKWMLKFCLYQTVSSFCSPLTLCPALLFPSCSQICSQRPLMFIVTSSASLWFVKRYDLLMKEDANIAAVLCCVLHFCYSFKTYKRICTETSSLCKLKYQ